ncbi:hypothetical protein P9112_013378 [Eukaryota sp. TZLM1-RC]
MSPPDSPQLFDFPLFDIVHELQSTYGASLGDFQRYQQYCSRRLHRLRQSLKHTHPRKQKPKTITPDDVRSDRFFLIKLLEAERAWSHAMYLKQEAASQKSTKVMHHALSRLSKAVKHSSLLAELIEHKGSEKAKQLAKQYHLQLEHALAMEKQADVTGHVTVSLGQDQMAINLILPASPTLIRAIMGINEALKVLNVNINNLESKTEEEIVGVFQPLLMCLGETEDALRSVQGSIDEETRESFNKAFEYVHNEKANRVLHRNLVMALLKKKEVEAGQAKSTELVRLLEILISNCEPLEEELGNVLGSCFRSLRVFYSALSFSKALQFNTAAELYGKSYRYLSQSIILIDELMVGNVEFMQQLKNWVVLVNSQAKSLQYSTVADAIIGSKNHQSYFDCVTKNSNIADYPPKLEVVHAKPFVLDLVYNCVDFPELDDKIADLQKKEKKEKGILRGFFKK